MLYLHDAVVDEAQEKMRIMTEVAQYRDQLWAGSEKKAVKVVIAAVVGVWAIYYFLIK